MSRDINTLTKEELKKNYTYCYLGEFQFKEETVYLNTSPIEVTFKTQKFLGIGAFARLQPFPEKIDISKVEMPVYLSGINEDIREATAKLEYANRKAFIWRCLMNRNNYAFIGAPYLYYSGIMTNMSFNEVEIELKITNQFANWDQTQVGRYSDAEQKTIDNSDTGLSHMPEVVDNINSLNLDWRPAIT